MLVHAKKAFLVHSVQPGTEYTWSFSLLTFFGIYQGISYSHTSRVVKKIVNTLLMGNIAPVLKVLLCFRISAFGFEATHHPSSYANYIVDKTYHGSVTITRSKYPTFFSLLLIDIFWLFNKLDHTRRICDNLFYLQRSFKLPQQHWHHSHNNRKWLKQPQGHFH